MPFNFIAKPAADLSIAVTAGGGRESYLDLRDAIHGLPVGQSIEVPVDYWTSNGVSKPDLDDSDKVSSWRSARRGTINKFIKSAPAADPSGAPRGYRVVNLSGRPADLAVIAEAATPTDKPEKPEGEQSE